MYAFSAPQRCQPGINDHLQSQNGETEVHGHPNSVGGGQTRSLGLPDSTVQVLSHYVMS